MIVTPTNAGRVAISTMTIKKEHIETQCNLININFGYRDKSMGKISKYSATHTHFYINIQSECMRESVCVCVLLIAHRSMMCGKG